VPPGFEQLAMAWARQEADGILALIWSGCDRLAVNYMSRIAWNQRMEEVERCLNMWLSVCIGDEFGGYEPFRVVHRPIEVLTRQAGKAQSPEYDLAFVWRDHEAVLWPVEGKILQTDGALARYVKEVRSNYLTCRYAPLAGEGAMLGYLRKGSPPVALSGLSSKLGVPFNPHPQFSAARPHSVSDHTRSVPPGKPFTSRFRCHHLILLVR